MPGVARQVAFRRNITQNVAGAIKLNFDIERDVTANDRSGGASGSGTCAG